MSTARYAIVVLAAVLAAAMPASLDAQNCRKGIPCGNTCISASKVCHVGQGTARSVSDDSPEPVNPAAAPLTPSSVTTTGTSTPTKYHWIGSFADGIYFQATCVAVQDLAPPNRRYFASELIAQDAGYRRSQVPGC
jgi:hypothetical protein